MKVGFTGSRHGMSKPQEAQFRFMLGNLWRDAGVQEFYYGTHEDVALKADALAERIAFSYGFQCIPEHAKHGEELARNRRIVEAVDLLIAAPETDVEQQRSGTWATVRYARKAGIPVVMLSRG